VSTPRVVAVIPARGGSKGVPGKNLRRVAGRSLVERAVDACVAATAIDAVYVSTDDAAIATAARSAGGDVVDRPARLAPGDPQHPDHRPAGGQGHAQRGAHAVEAATVR